MISCWSLLSLWWWRSYIVREKLEWTAKEEILSDKIAKRREFARGKTAKEDGEQYKKERDKEEKKEKMLKNNNKWQKIKKWKRAK